MDKIKMVMTIAPRINPDLASFYVTSATNFVLSYCGFDTEDEIPTALDTTIVEMAVFKYRQKDVENKTAEGKSSFSESFLTDYPSTIINALNPHTQVKFI